jgi:hypothetical protein
MDRYVLEDMRSENLKNLILLLIEILKKGLQIKMRIRICSRFKV